MLSGLHEGSFANVQLGAGVLLTGLEVDACQDATQLRTQIARKIRSGDGVIGLTRGGGKLTCTPLLRSVEADGVRTPRKGSVVLDGWTITLSGTMLEMTADNLTHLLGAADVTCERNKKTITLRGRLEEEDYLPRLCWVGDTPKGLLLAEMTDCLSVGGLTLAFSDEREGSLPFTFRAHQGMEEAWPFRLMLLEEEAEA